VVGFAKEGGLGGGNLWNQQFHGMGVISCPPVKPWVGGGGAGEAGMITFKEWTDQPILGGGGGVEIESQGKE